VLQAGSFGLLWEPFTIDEFHNVAIARVWSDWSGTNPKPGVACVRITHVKKGSVAERCGLKVGMIVLSVAGQPTLSESSVESPAEPPWAALEELGQDVARPKVCVV